MPQPKKGPRLGAGPSHQRLMLANMAASLFQHERLRTTEAKAKMLRPLAERLITKAKNGDVHHRRQVLSVVQDRDVVHKLFEDIAPRFAERNGGYTRILKLGPRGGDGAPMALIELLSDGVAAAAADRTEDEAEEGTRRRRLRPSRRGRQDLPQDKPSRSRAAQAAAEGTPLPGEVTPPEHAEEESAEAEAAAEEQAAAATEVDSAEPTSGAEGGQGGTPPRGSSG